MNITCNIYKTKTRFPLPRGLALWANAKISDYFVYFRCNTHAYVRCNIDAYIRFPTAHAYITCFAAAAAAGNNGDCTVVFQIPLLCNAA